MGDGGGVMLRLNAHATPVEAAPHTATDEDGRHEGAEDRNADPVVGWCSAFTEADEHAARPESDVDEGRDEHGGEDVAPFTSVE